MTLGFVHLKKAIDTEPRKMVVRTITHMCVSDAEARMVEAMYERQKGRFVVGHGMYNEFQVNIGLRRGSALRKIMYADDLAIIVESK